ncbi:MAG: hypothetical protein WBP26_01915 [Candidatus Saccharimonadales bacterium]
MSLVGILSIVVPVLVTILVVVIVVAKKKKPLNKEYFAKHWQEVQKLCGSKSTWPLAIINADKLLDEALRKSNYKGKSGGERLVSAQRRLTDNDGIWTAHKLRNKLVHEHDEAELKEKEVKGALIAFRQALKDLGAL